MHLAPFCTGVIIAILFHTSKSLSITQGNVADSLFSKFRVILRSYLPPDALEAEDLTRAKGTSSDFCESVDLTRSNASGAAVYTNKCVYKCVKRGLYMCKHLIRHESVSFLTWICRFDSLECLWCWSVHIVCQKWPICIHKKRKRYLISPSAQLQKTSVKRDLIRQKRPNCLTKGWRRPSWARGKLQPRATGVGFTRIIALPFPTLSPTFFEIGRLRLQTSISNRTSETSDLFRSTSEASDFARSHV